MLSADLIALIAEIKAIANYKMRRGEKHQNPHVFKLRRSKTEYVKYKFTNGRQRNK